MKLIYKFMYRYHTSHMAYHHKTNTYSFSYIYKFIPLHHKFSLNYYYIFSHMLPM